MELCQVERCLGFVYFHRFGWSLPNFNISVGFDGALRWRRQRRFRDRGFQGVRRRDQVRAGTRS